MGNLGTLEGEVDPTARTAAAPVPRANRHAKVIAKVELSSAVTHPGVAGECRTIGAIEAAGGTLETTNTETEQWQNNPTIRHAECNHRRAR